MDDINGVKLEISNKFKNIRISQCTINNIYRNEARKTEIFN